jgi:hypothetical protein
MGIIDFIDLDVFFWYIYSDVMPAKRKAEREVKAVPVARAESMRNNMLPSFATRFQSSDILSAVNHTRA